MKHKFIFLVFLLLLFTSNFAFAEEITEPTLIWEMKEGEITKNSYTEVKVEGEEFPFYSVYYHSRKGVNKIYYFLDGEGNIKHKIEANKGEKLIISENGKFCLKRGREIVPTYYNSDGTILWQKSSGIFWGPNFISPTSERFISLSSSIEFYPPPFILWNQDGNIIFRDDSIHVYGGDFSPNGEYILVKLLRKLAFYDKNGNKLWDRKYELSSHNSKLFCPTMNIAEKYCGIKGYNSYNREFVIEIYATSNGNLLWRQTFEKAHDHKLRFSPDGKYLFTYRGNRKSENQINLYNSKDGVLLWSKILNVPYNFSIRSISISNDAEYLAIGGRIHNKEEGWTECTLLFDKEGKLINKFEEKNVGCINLSELSQNGKYLLINYEKNIQMYFLP